MSIPLKLISQFGLKRCQKKREVIKYKIMKFFFENYSIWMRIKALKIRSVQCYGVNWIPFLGGNVYCIGYLYARTILELLIHKKNQGDNIRLDLYSGYLRKKILSFQLRYLWLPLTRCLSKRNASEKRTENPCIER